MNSTAQKKADLVVILGAGASMPCGVPGTVDLSKRALAALPSPVRELLVEALRGAYGEFNFELLLYAIEALELFVKSGGSSSLQYRPVMSAFADLLLRYRDLADRSILAKCRRSVVAALHQTVGSASASVVNTDDLKARELQHDFVKELAKHFRLIVVDLNYDTLWDDILDNWDDGYRKRDEGYRFALFDGTAWLGALESDRNLLLHLHGSCRFSYCSDLSVTTTLTHPSEQVRYDSALEALNAFNGTITSGSAVGGSDASALPLISGLGKITKLTNNMRPFGHYQLAAATAVLRTPRLLLIGYGGHDEHLNTWLEEHARIHGETRRDAAILLVEGAMLDKTAPRILS